MRTRHEITQRYLHGHGLEIAGLHNPWPMNQGSRSIQMDLFTTEQLYAQYPEHKNNNLVRVQILDDGSKCKSIADNSMDFVVSSHVLEHCEDVAQAIENWIRITKPLGFIAVAVPERSNPMDFRRPVTPVDHFMDEWNKGSLDLREHYEEYYRLVDNLQGDALTKRVEESLISRPHIHFHTFTHDSLLDLLQRLAIKLNFTFHEYEFVVHEMLFVIQKDK